MSLVNRWAIAAQIRLQLDIGSVQTSRAPKVCLLAQLFAQSHFRRAERDACRLALARPILSYSLTFGVGFSLGLQFCPHLTACRVQIGFPLDLFSLLSSGLDFRAACYRFPLPSRFNQVFLSVSKSCR